MSFEFRHMSHAVALANARNFAKAAKSLHLSQSALSRSIQALEQELGVILFDRGRRGVEPTDAGHLFLKRAHSLLSQMGALEREMAVTASRRIAELRIGMGPYAAELLGGSAVARCIMANANIRFSLLVDHWENIARRLEDRDIDIAICETSELPRNGLEIIPLKSQKGCVVVRRGHPVLESEIAGLQTILAYPLVSTARLPVRILEKLLPPGSGPGFRPAVRCENLGVVERILRVSDAVALAPASLYAEAVRRGELCLIDCLPDEIRTSFGLVRLVDRQIPEELQRFVRVVMEVDQESAALSEALRAEGLIVDRHPRKPATASNSGTSTRK
jgi:DNA-binding transcriptional LysR family regulator